MGASKGNTVFSPVYFVIFVSILGARFSGSTLFATFSKCSYSDVLIVRLENL